MENGTKRMTLKYTRINFTLLITLGLLAACASHTVTTAPISPELSQQGLLVAKLSSDNKDRFPLAQVQINTKIYKNNYHDGGYIVIALAPGVYTVNSVISLTQGDTVTYPMDKKFHIEAGKASNLGVLFFLTDVKDAKKYTLSQLDNTEEAQRYLQAAHPALYAALHHKVPQLVPGQYLEAPELMALRKEIALRAGAGKGTEAITDGEFVTGPLGTLARIQKGPQGTNKIDMIETYTLEDVDHQRCGIARRRLACVLGGRLITMNGAERRAQPLPSPMAAVDRAHVFGARGMVLTDRRLHIFSSLDHGLSWGRYDDAVLNEPLDRDARMDFENGAQGFYIYSTGRDRTVLYSPYAQLAYKKMELPTMVQRVERLREFNGGVIIGPEFTERGDAILYIGSFDPPQWVERRIPATQCTQIQLEDRSGEKLSAVCLAQTYYSNDGGRTWTKSN